MSILVHKHTRVITQGITGEYGKLHTLACRAYGTNVVGGVTPGRGGTDVEGIPVFDTVADAVARTGADTTMIFVPAAFAADAVEEAVEAGLGLIVCITEGIPALDEARMKRSVTAAGARMIGPNCPGIISPGEKAKVGIMPGFIHRPGRIGVVSRSGTLTYEAVWQLSERKLGQSTCIGIGGDPVIGTTHIDALRLFQEDSRTDAILMIGEIGGTAEEEAAAFVRDHVTKPVVGFVAGATAPAGKRMGHAGAIIAGGKGTAAEKMAAMREAGILVAESPADMGATMVKALARGSQRRAAKTKASPARTSAGAVRPAKTKQEKARKAAARTAPPQRKAAAKKAAKRKAAAKKPARRKAAAKTPAKRKAAARPAPRKKAAAKQRARKQAAAPRKAARARPGARAKGRRKK